MFLSFLESSELALWSQITQVELWPHDSGKSFTLSWPPFSHVQNEDARDTHLMVVSGGSDGSIRVRHPEQYMAHSGHSVSPLRRFLSSLLLSALHQLLPLVPYPPGSSLYPEALLWI